MLKAVVSAYIEAIEFTDWENDASDAVAAAMEDCAAFLEYCDSSDIDLSGLLHYSRL